MSILLKTLQIFDNVGRLSATITDDISINIRQSRGRKGGGMGILLKNPISRFDGTSTFGKHVVDGEFRYSAKKDWTIKLFLKYSDTNETIDTVSTKDLIMTADITETEARLSERQSIWKLKCTDKAFLMLNKLWSFNYTVTDALTAPQMIQTIIRITTGDGKGVGSSDVKAELVDDFSTPINGIQNLRPDGSAFPVKTIAKLHKPVYEWIEELSQPEMTNTVAELASTTIPAPRPFYFYIDEQNRAIWNSPEVSTPEYLMTIGATTAVSPDTVKHNIYGFNLNRGQVDTVNMIIFNGGDDFFGSGILDYNYDRTTTASKLKAVYRPWTQIAQGLKEEEILGTGSANYAEDNSTPGTLTFQDKRYTASYNFTPSWSSTQVTDDAELNNSFRTEVIRRGDANSERIFAGKGSPLWKGKIELKGFKFKVGELIKFNSTIHGIVDALIRITDVQHNINKGGWFTTLTVAEDSPAIIG